ncbi:MAG TPA: choice-of-anchor A family protein [Myxococcaceae bacterium]
MENTSQFVAADGSTISITCPPKMVVHTNKGECKGNPTFEPRVVASNGVQSLTCNPASGSNFPLGSTEVRCTVTDLKNYTASCGFMVEVKDLPPRILMIRDTESKVDGACKGTLPDIKGSVVVADDCTPWSGLEITQTPAPGTRLDAGTHVITFQVKDNSGNISTGTANHTVKVPAGQSCGPCRQLRLSDYNVFVFGDYTEGTDVRGKVAAGGNITLQYFSMGMGLQGNDNVNTLVAGGDLTLSDGGIWGNAWYGGTYSAGYTVTYDRGRASRGTPIDFAAEKARLLSLSEHLAGLTVNGTAKLEPWGGLMLHGSNAQLNVFHVKAADLSKVRLMSINAPAGSLVVINITGSPVTLSSFGYSFAGGIDQRGVLYNFVDAETINASHVGIFGTVLAPKADITFRNGSFDGGIYAKSLTGNAEGHINPLSGHTICR